MKKIPQICTKSLNFSSKNLFAVFHIIIKKFPPSPTKFLRTAMLGRSWSGGQVCCPPPPLFLLSSWVCLCIILAIHVVCPPLRNIQTTLSYPEFFLHFLNWTGCYYPLIHEINYNLVSVNQSIYQYHEFSNNHSAFNRLTQMHQSIDQSVNQSSIQSPFSYFNQLIMHN